MAKTKIPQGKPPKKSATPAAGTGLEGKLRKLKVDDGDGGGGCFSFDRTAPVVKKQYCKNKVDKVEVDFLVPPSGEEYFKYKLRDDGEALYFLHATPEWFGEEKRMKKQIGNAYRENDPRVGGHDLSVQEIRKKEKADDKKFWGKKPQIVKLPVKCEGPPKKHKHFTKPALRSRGINSI